jgi:hypothetical protein
MPEGAVYVGRPGPWGNPFRAGYPLADHMAHLTAGVRWNGRPLGRNGRVIDAQHAVDLFAFWVLAKVPFTEADVVAALAGHDLACWCPLDQPCHADVLLEIANGGG